MFSSSAVLELAAPFGSAKMELLEARFCCQFGVYKVCMCLYCGYSVIMGPLVFSRHKNMLVTSAIRRERLSGGSGSSHSLGGSKPGGGLRKAEGCSKRAVDEASAVLRSAFPQGVQENSFSGSDETVGEQHCKFLESWYGLGSISVPSARKAWQLAFPNLGSSSVNAVLKEVSGIKTYLLRKQRNAKTGERMATWVKKLVAVLNCHLHKVEASGSKAGRSAKEERPVQRRGVEKRERDRSSSAEESAEASDCISVSSSVAASQSSAVLSLRGQCLKRPAASNACEGSSGAKKRPASANTGGSKRGMRQGPRVAGMPLLWAYQGHSGHGEVIHSE